MALAFPLFTLDTPMAVSTTTESVMLRPSPMPGAMALAFPLFILDTPMAVSTTMESVMLRPSPMPGAMALAFPLFTLDTPMAVFTTTESVMLMLSPIPGAMASLSTLDTPMPMVVSMATASKDILSSGLNCATFKNCVRRIIQLPDSWIPKNKFKMTTYYKQLSTFVKNTQFSSQ